MGHLFEMVVRRSKDFITKRNIDDSGVYAAYQALVRRCSALDEQGALLSFDIQDIFPFTISLSAQHRRPCDRLFTKIDE